jgi:hypothetical protein
MAVATTTPRLRRRQPCLGSLGAAITAWANFVVALVALALAILFAEDQWLLVVTSWYVAGSWFACALTSIRCLPTQTESPVTWAFSVRPQRHREGDAATGARSTRSRRPLRSIRRTSV